MNLSRLERHANAIMSKDAPSPKYRPLQPIPQDSKARIAANLRMFEERGLLPKKSVEP